MRRVIRLLALLLALLPVAGCTTAEAIPEEAVRTLTLCVEDEVGEAATQAARLFADKVVAISGGRLTVQLVDTADALGDMLSARYDLYLITNATAARGNGDYACFSSPYYFGDYYHMSLALNSERFGELMDAKTRSAINVTPMAALYGGARVFVLANEPEFDSLEAIGEDDRDIYLLTPNTVLESALRDAGLSLRMATRDETITAFRQRRTRIFEFEKRELDRLEIPSNVDTLAIVSDFHYVTVHWLMISTQADESLSDYQRSVLREASAFALAQNDIRIETEETEAMYALIDTGLAAETGAMGGELALQIEALVRGSADNANRWNWETYDEIRKIAE